MRMKELAQLRLGDRVYTVFGMGTVVCFEDHDIRARHIHHWLVSSFGGNGRVVVNTLSVPLFWSRELYLTSIMYGFFWINAIVSYIHWRKIQKSVV